MAVARKKQPTFVTERLRVRPFRRTDLKALHTLYSDADNLRYWSVPASANLESTRKILRWHLSFQPRHYCGTCSTI
jgi:[ribosomal protein S5]-alanine N-acetyltransferase